MEKTGLGGWFFAQTMLVVIVLLTAVLAPPSRGAFIVVPLLPGDRIDTLNHILAKGGRIAGLTRPGSFPVVMGSRDPLAIDALMHGALLLRAPEIACGKPTPAKGSD
jgi:hypothetical protein